VAEEAAVEAEGRVHSGMLGAGTMYRDMSDEEVQKHIDSTFGDIQAQAYLNDKKQLDELKSSLSTLTNAIQGLDVLKNMGRVQKVEAVIVEDRTNIPGVTPNAPATSGADSSSTEEGH
jgi:hypothetical protein